MGSFCSLETSLASLNSFCFVFFLFLKQLQKQVVLFFIDRFEPFLRPVSQHTDIIKQPFITKTWVCFIEISSVVQLKEHYTRNQRTWGLDFVQTQADYLTSLHSGILLWGLAVDV